MINRFILAFFGVLALCWIGFVSYGLLHKENSADFRSYFDESDGIVWAIHHPEEINWNDQHIQTIQLNQSIYSSVVPRIQDATSLFFSAKRVLFLIEKRTSWDKQDIKNLFQQGLFPLELGKLNDFQYGKLHGIYKGNQLLIYEGELNQAKGFAFSCDVKASFSKIKLAKSKLDYVVSDSYVKHGKIYTYAKSYIGKNTIKEIDDQRIFAPFVPSNIDAYTFYEQGYLAHVDPIFARSPFSKKMISNGIVFITKDSVKAAIFDYQEEYSPIEILNEKLNLEEANENSAQYKQLQFSGFLTSEKTELYVAQSNGFAVVSASKELVDFVIAEAELANTLSQDEKRVNLIFGNLPKKVAFRSVSRSKQNSVSVYGKKLVETSCRFIDVVEQKENQKIKDYFVMNPGERVLLFVALPERGNVIAYTDKGKLVGYINGLKKWEKQCAQEVSALHLIDVGQSFAAVQMKNEVQLFDRTGRLVFRMSNLANVKPAAYFTKSKLEFAVANASNSIQLVSEKGAVVKPFQVVGAVKQMEVCSKSKKPTLGVLTESTYYTIDLEKRKTIGKYTVDSTYHLVNTGKEIMAVSIQNGALHLIKNGKSTQFQTKNNVQLLGTYLNNQELIYVLSRGKELYAYQSNGKILWEKSLQAQEITSMSISYAQNGSALLCILDAVENELYIFDQLGRASDQNERHGEGQVQVSPFGSSAYSITTFLGSYLIQYTKQ
ncbi:MAG: hypothetical protein RLZZ30_1204 [Bacteroidota bacterium]